MLAGEIGEGGAVAGVAEEGRARPRRAISQTAGDRLEPGEWHELHFGDPPTGLVRIKGVRLRDPDDEHSDLDPEVTFSIEELWREVGPAQSVASISSPTATTCTTTASTNAGTSTPPAIPRCPYHQHPPSGGDRRSRRRPIGPPEAIRAFDAWIDEGGPVTGGLRVESWWGQGLSVAVKALALEIAIAIASASASASAAEYGRLPSRSAHDGQRDRLLAVDLEFHDPA